MELTGERMLAVDRAAAWAALNDIELLRLCIPGCEALSAIGDNRYEATVSAAIGPVKARFKGTLELTDIDAPNGYTLRFDGNAGQAGFTRGQARVTLAAAPAGQTVLRYVAQVQVGGKLAQVGSRLIDAASGAMADKFFGALGAQLSARAAHPGAVQAGSAQAGAAGTAAPAAAKLGFWSLLLATLRRLFRSRATGS